jgi:hypothetical protein
MGLKISFSRIWKKPYFRVRAASRRQRLSRAGHNVTIPGLAQPGSRSGMGSERKRWGSARWLASYRDDRNPSARLGSLELVDRSTTGSNSCEPSGRSVDGGIAQRTGLDAVDELKHLAKVRVAGPNPVFRSRIRLPCWDDVAQPRGVTAERL